MSDDTILPFGFPAIGRKKLIAAFDGGRITTEGGVLLLGAVERQLGIAAKMARLIADPRNPASLFSGSGVVALEGQRRGKVSDRIDVQHLGADAAIEGLDHTTGLRRTRLGVAILRAQFGAGFGKGLGEAAAVGAGQPAGDLAAVAARGTPTVRRGLLAATTPAWQYWAATDGTVTVFRGTRHSVTLRSVWISPPLASGLRLRDPIEWSPVPPRPGWTLVREIQAAEYHDLTVAKEARAEAWWAVHHPHKPMPGRFATGMQDSWVLNRDL